MKLNRCMLDLISFLSLFNETNKKTKSEVIEEIVKLGQFAIDPINAVSNISWNSWLCFAYRQDLCTFMKFFILHSLFSEFVCMCLCCIRRHMHQFQLHYFIQWGSLVHSKCIRFRFTWPNSVAIVLKLNTDEIDSKQTKKNGRLIFSRHRQKFFCASFYSSIEIFVGMPGLSYSYFKLLCARARVSVSYFASNKRTFNKKFTEYKAAI